MKQKTKQWAGRALPAIGLIALPLAVVAMATTPFAMSKYAAAGMADASARVAKWDIWIAPVYPGAGGKAQFRPRLRNNGAALRPKYQANDNSFASGAWVAGWQEFSVHNDSEVSARYTMFVLRAKDKDFDFGTVTDPLAGKNAGGTVVASKSDSILISPFLSIGSYAGAGQYMNGYYDAANCALPAVTDNQDCTWTSDPVAPGETAWFQIFFYEPGSPAFNGYLTPGRKGATGADAAHLDVAKGEKCKLYILAEQVD